ncbi:pectate lyase [Niveispirillum irakense]|uniref:pectate lyase n=1 Tax=Niveispirillum irakense TaxID=34011 RepID=UPI0003F4EB93|nr:pectate lyase [Niveispirillum irakense]
MMNRSALRRALLSACALYFLFPAIPSAAREPSAATTTMVAQVPEKQTILDTMKRATRFMVEKAAVQGGYVWTYLPDLSRRWGEMEASPTMIWVQPPGTPTMGHLFLDAYRATGDEYYYDAARQAVDALVRGQLPGGGWNYLIDTAGPAAEKRWYETYGRNAWRMEEFQHYYGNATFDDAGTSEAAQLLLRLYLEKRDETYRAPLEKVIQFMLDAQLPNGGWPQRFPHVDHGGLHGRPDYTGHVTFNDDVIGENLEFLIFAYQTLGDERLPAAIRRGMDIFIATQQPKPQAGWGLQHDVKTLKPVGARTYEPEALATHTTASNIRALISFYQLTGDRKYLARVEEAIDWLDSVRAPADMVKGRDSHPTFIEIGTGRPLFLHRRGSNVVNGSYYTNQNPKDVIIHYQSFRAIDVDGLRKAYAAALTLDPAELARNSPLLAKAGTYKLPAYFSLRDVSVADMAKPAAEKAPVDAAVSDILTTLNDAGYWPAPLTFTTNPYKGDGPETPVGGEYRTTNVGDLSDTSPYVTDFPVQGISTRTYVRNMGDLIRTLVGNR